MFSEQLRQARLVLGISQKTVAELLKITRPIYNQIEQGKILPKYEDLPKLAKLLNLDLENLQKSMCIHPKIECIHRTPRKSSIDTYRLTVPLDRTEFSKLTKSNLKKCGYNNLREFMKMAYMQLENQLQEIENKEELWQKTK